MSYKYACFISYKRPPNWAAQPGLPLRDPNRHILAEFAKAFQEELDYFLSLPVPSFRDVNLVPGSMYPQQLSQNLCSSLCMVALVVPQYFESAWCMAEWNAMTKFEIVRLGLGGGSLIIPVVVNGDIRVLEQRFGGRTARDLRGLSAPGRQLRNPRNRDKIRMIADIINSMEGLLHGFTAWADCDQFSLGLGPEAVTPQFPETSPLSR
jgi:TIR domain